LPRKTQERSFFFLKQGGVFFSQWL